MTNNKKYIKASTSLLSTLRNRLESRKETRLFDLLQQLNSVTSIPILRPKIQIAIEMKHPRNANVLMGGQENVPVPLRNNKQQITNNSGTIQTRNNSFHEIKRVNRLIRNKFVEFFYEQIQFRCFTNSNFISEIILKIFQNAHVCPRANDECSPIVCHQEIQEILQLSCNAFQGTMSSRI